MEQSWLYKEVLVIVVNEKGMILAVVFLVILKCVCNI